MATASIAQLNVRMERELKNQGDATLSLAGSSPVRIIRQLWEFLASGGDAYERVMAVISPAKTDVSEGQRAQSRVARSAGMFQEMGASLGLDIATFTPDLRPEHDVLEEIEWGLLEGKGLA